MGPPKVPPPSYETIRQWCQTFGLDYARRLRHGRGRMGDTWYLDELFVTIRGSAGIPRRSARSCPQ